jgi:hypothetical protein
MKLKSVKFRMTICILAMFAFQLQVWAPPQRCIEHPEWCEHYHWMERSYAYAETFWNGTNSEYGRCVDQYNNPVDCANFTSQIANAGCSGMAESNNTNNWSPIWEAPNGDCWNYYNNEPNYQTADNCDPRIIRDGSGRPQGSGCNSQGTGNHTVVFRAYAQSWWFYCSNQDIPDQAVSVTNPDDIPWWVFLPTFAFVQWRSNGQWHAVYIGEGAQRNARYWAHNTDRRSSPITNLFNSDTHHVEFYGPIPICIK